MNNNNKNNGPTTYTRLYKNNEFNDNKFENKKNNNNYNNTNKTYNTNQTKTFNKTSIPYFFCYVKKASNYKIPEIATYGSAAYDIFSNEDIILKANTPTLIGTGLHIAIPQSHCLMVCSRSGLAIKNKVRVYNSPGIIDSDYRGEIKIILINEGTEDFQINIGDRIAQLFPQQKIRINFKEVDELTPTQRSDKGFGSTGTNEPIKKFFKNSDYDLMNNEDSDKISNTIKNESPSNQNQHIINEDESIEGEIISPCGE